MNRSGNLLATNDTYIEEIIKDPLYEIRPDGTIWTLVCQTGKVSVKDEWRQAGGISADGYYSVRYNNVHLQAHRIIYRKYVGPLFKDLVVNHKNGIRSDNRPENLELVTQGNNNTHRFQVLGRKAVIGNKKIDDLTADAIRNDHANGLSYNKLKEKYGMSKSSISYIINKKTWNREVTSAHDFKYETKLNFEIAEKIREGYKQGTPRKELAKKYNAGKTTIQAILSGKTWKSPVEA